MQFDEWLDSIQSSDKKYISIFTIKDLIKEASQTYDKNRASPITIPEINELYEQWFGEETLTMEKEEVILLLRDMFESL